MAKITQREFRILVKALGLEEFTKQMGVADKKMKSASHQSGVLDRALKGTAGATSNSTKEFAKQAQGLGGLVHVYATVAANVFALGAAFTVLKRNADLQILEKASASLSNATGLNFANIAKQMKEVSGGALSIQEAMQQANLALSGGLSTTQLEEITLVARKAAAATGRSVSESVQRMVQAVVKGEPELVDEFGIILRVGKAVDDYALAHNKAASALTTFERQQAIAAQAIERGKKAYDSINVNDIENPYEQLQKSVTELGNSIISLISGPISGLANILKGDSTLLATIIAAISIAIAKKAVPSLNNFAETFKKNNEEIIKSSKKMAKEAKRNIAEVGDGYAHFIQSNKSLAKNIKGVVAGSDFDPRSLIQRTIKNGGSDKAVIQQFAKSISGTYKKQFLAMLTELDSTTHAKINFMGKKIRRDQANQLLTALAKEEELMNKSLGKRAALFWEYNKGIRSTLAATTQYHKAQMQLRVATVKQYAAESASAGFAAGITGSFGVAKDQATKAVEKTGSKTLGLFSGATAIASGLLGTVVNIGSKLLGWGLAIQIVWSLLGPIANAIGIWNSSISEAVDKVIEINDNHKDTIKILDKIKEINDKQDASYEERIVNLQRQVTIFGEMSAKLITINETIDKIGEMGAIQSFFSKSGSLEDISKAIETQVDTLRNLGVNDKTISVGVNINDLADKEYAPGVTRKAVETTSIQTTIDLSKTALENIELLRASLSEEQLRQTPDLIERFMKAYVKGLEDLVKKPSELASKTKAAFNSIDQSFKTISDNVSKKQAKLTSDGPFASYLTSFQTVDKEIQSIGGTFTESGDIIFNNAENAELLKQAFDRLEPAAKKAFDISAPSDLLGVLNKLKSVQLEYLTIQENIALTTEAKTLSELKASNGSIQAITEIYNAERTLNDLKIRSISIEISAKEKLKSQDKESARLIDIQIAQLRAKQNILRETSLIKYSKEQEQIDKINKALEKTIGLITRRKNLLEASIDLSSTNVSNQFGSDKSALMSEELRHSQTMSKLRLEEENILANITASASNILLMRKGGLSVEKEKDSINKLQAEYTKNETARLKENIAYLSKSLEISKKIYQNKLDILTEEIALLNNQQSIAAKISANFKMSKTDRINALNIEKSLIIENSNASIDKTRLIIKQREDEISKLKNTKDIVTDTTAIEKLQILNKQSHLDLLTAQFDKQAALLEQSSKQLEVEKELYKYGDKGFTNVVGRELQSRQREFEKTRKKDADIIADLVTEPIFSAMDALTQGIIDGSKSASEILSDTFKAGYESVRDIIMSKVNNDFKSEVYKFMSTQFGINLGSNDPVELQKTANDLLRQIASNTGGIGGIGGIGGTGSLGGLSSGLFSGLLGNYGDFSSTPGIDIGSFGGYNPIQGSGSFFGDIFSGIGSFFGFAKGGIMSPLGKINTYDTGGIASSPQLAMFGEGRQNEAFVPLPDNKTIPVTLSGGQGDTIQINISIDASGNTTSQNSGDNKDNNKLDKFGAVLSTTIRQVIIDEKRPGGLLA